LTEFSIFFSPAYSEENYYRVVTKHHHTLKVSLHYLLKYKSVKSVNIFGEDMNKSLRLTF